MLTQKLCGENIRIEEADAVVVGSGAAGYNCADELCRAGLGRVVILTEGRCMGTSRNTGSDKQTYFKLNTSGGDPDSVLDMAQTYFKGGSMHGDLALAQAAGSLRGFYKLVNLGVPFPYNEYGEYVGYRTDHDLRTRATSCGPYTSKYMTEALEKAALEHGAELAEGWRAAKITKDGGRVSGVIAVRMNPTEDEPLISLWRTKYLVWATGGPSAIYEYSVYPESQGCSLGVPLETGADGINLTESQYGLASLGFRWNLSGSFQQVIPRYFSVGADGKEREFLNTVFESRGQLFAAIFSKGYEWPFDASRVRAGSRSSAIDTAVFDELQLGRKVYIDFTRNPEGFSFGLLNSEARSYLEKSGAVADTPVQRLISMNRKAYGVFYEHGTDLKIQPVPVAVCAQHCNGGIAVDSDWQTTLPGLFAAGEAAGTFGVRRPGGSALNATQVDSLRAAQRIASLYHGGGKEKAEPSGLTDAEATAAAEILAHVCSDGGMTEEQIGADILEGKHIFSGCAAQERDVRKVTEAAEYFKAALKASESLRAGRKSLAYLLLDIDIKMTSAAFLEAVRAYTDAGGGSRGGYMITEDGKIRPADEKYTSYVLYTHLAGGSFESHFEPVRPIPDAERWFEKVYGKQK